MRLLRNSGNERVIDQLRDWLHPGTSIDLMSPEFSLHAFAETRDMMAKPGDVRLLLGEEIRATRPVIIVDEPQSVDGGLEGRGKQALGEMLPLCTLRYSATHVDKHHMVYRLDAVDAYAPR